MDAPNFTITLDTLRDALQHDKEIELSLNGCPYFAQLCTAPPLPACYQIWDVISDQCIFRGGLDETLDFPFPGALTLKENFDDFEILYIL